MAVDMFLKLDGIDGESHDSKHQNEIEISSYSFGASNPSSFNSRGGGASAGKVSMQDFHFVMSVNKASPKLMLACATGEHIKQGTLTVRKAGEKPVEYYVVTFTDLLVSSYQTGGNSNFPTDQFSLSFSKIEVDYTPQSPDGSLGSPVHIGWDLKQNKGA